MWSGVGRFGTTETVPEKTFLSFLKKKVAPEEQIIYIINRGRAIEHLPDH